MTTKLKAEIIAPANLEDSTIREQAVAALEALEKRLSADQITLVNEHGGIHLHTENFVPPGGGNTVNGFFVKGAPAHPAEQGIHVTVARLNEVDDYLKSASAFETKGVIKLADRPLAA